MCEASDTTASKLLHLPSATIDNLFFYYYLFIFISITNVECSVLKLVQYIQYST